MNHLATAPKDGSCVLLWFYPRVASTRERFNYVRTPMPKWEECRWISDQEQTGSKPHWEPWCGDYRINTTEYINDEDVLGWLPLPNK